MGITPWKGSKAMDMGQVLNRAVERIRSGKLGNEAQVKQAVILPILRALEWDDSEPSEFLPEFSVELSNGRGSVDYALLRSSVPLVFIEAKRLGNANDSGIEQVFGYAANRGVPFLVLTDGNVWDFYLSMADGIPAERRFYRIELQRQDKIADHARFFEQYLHKSRVGLPETRIEAEQLRDGDRQKAAAKAAIPKAWRDLLKTPDETLCSLIADVVEGECGTRPELDDVETFLNGALADSISSVPTSPVPRTPITTGQSDRSVVTLNHPETSSRKIVGFVLDGQRVDTGIANRVLAELLKEFQRRDSEFMERFSARTIGRTRRLVATNRDDLYDVVHLREDYSLDLGNGWWLGTNISTGTVRKYINVACDVIGVHFGSQLTLIER